MLTQSETKTIQGNVVTSDDPVFNNDTSFDKKKTKKKIFGKKQQYSPVTSVFNATGYEVVSKIACTLQGSIYKAKHANGNECVVKRASVKLHNRGFGQIGKKFYRVSENIIKEASIMKYLTKKNGPKGMIKFIDFYGDDMNWYLLMENGGNSVCEHVVKYHKKIRSGKMKVNVWKEHVQILFKQMCFYINWLHNEARVAHLDISLENMCIKDCEYKNGKFISHGQINFIDFGLAKRFDDNASFDKCKKYVGKTAYKSPEVYLKVPFNAGKADVWCMGVVLFVLTFGYLPYYYMQPNKNDAIFNMIYHGDINDYGNKIKKSKYLSKCLLDLLSHIFKVEEQRWTINEIMNHKYVN